jgi:demethylmenaquinone methyltransferase/2-methoxy-6-polyprenyl-1,4-benzoquinol methylase
MGHAYDGLFEGSGNAFLRTPMRTGNAHPLRVLDCGIGTGALSAAFARRHPDGLALDAVDLSPRMLTLAGKTLRKAGLDATLREADIRNLPYDDDIFDLVMAGHVLEHLADPAPALREMERVLRPGGAMLLCITRRSALGLYVHLKWRTHRVTHSEAEGWLNDLGLTSVRSVRLGGSVFARHLSIAVMGRKPRKAV